MDIIRWALLATGTALLSGCSTEPITSKPAALMIVSGDSQSGLLGTVLAESLVVEVRGTDGAAFAGADLAWQVISGAASVAPLTSISDGNGRAAIAVTLTTAGAGTITATADGLPPVAFQTLSVGPCAWRVPIGFTTTTTAALSSADCVYPDGSYIKYYSMTTTVQQAARIRLASSSFDAYLFLSDANNVPIADNDDDATSSNSEIQVIVAPGSYVVGANAFAAAVSGPFTLSSQPVAENIAACGLWYLTPAVATSQMLAASDCVSGGFYSDVAVIYLRSGSIYTFTETSSAFDAYLELEDANGNLVASDDNSAGANNARFVFRPLVSDIYFVVAQSLLANATGAYSLSVSAPVPVGTAGPAPTAVVRRPRLSWPGIAAIARQGRAKTRP